MQLVTMPGIALDGVKRGLFVPEQSASAFQQLLDSYSYHWKYDEKIGQEALRQNFRALSKNWCKWTPKVGALCANTMATSYWGARVLYMAGKQKTKPTDKSYGGLTFVNITVSEADEKKITAAYPTSDDVYSSFADLIAAGYRVGFSYDMRTDAVVCSLTCRDQDDVNYNRCLNSFAGDWYTALMVSLYKHEHMLKGNWTSAENGAKRAKFG